jgi:hypothetical protein
VSRSIFEVNVEKAGFSCCKTSVLSEKVVKNA